MRFKEFYTEDNQALQTKKLSEPLPPGYRMINLSNGKHIAIPSNMTDAQAIELMKNKYPDLVSMKKPASTQSSTQQPLEKTPTQTNIQQPRNTVDFSKYGPPKPGLRYMSLPNGGVVMIPQNFDDNQGLELVKKQRPDLLSSAPEKKKVPNIVIPQNLPKLPEVDTKLNSSAKKSAESYLGRKMTPREWDLLLRATYAESSHDVEEDAHIMGTILNRVRHGGFGGSIMSKVLASPNQFQSVTGVPGERVMHSNFTVGPPQENLNRILQAAITYLPKVPQEYVNFTAASEKAYKQGTNPEFLKRLQSAGGKLVGKSVFGKLS